MRPGRALVFAGPAPALLAALILCSCSGGAGTDGADRTPSIAGGSSETARSTLPDRVRRPVKQPNVILIVVDTLRSDHLGVYGYGRRTSPRIDALAAEGVVYRHAVSQAPWTTPSIASLLTSRYPSDLGILDIRSVLDDDAVTLAEALSAEGYATGAVVSHSFCSQKWGFGQGFDHFDGDNIQGHLAVTSPGVTDSALRMLDRLTEPFFLWVHYFDPHNKFLRHPEFEFGTGAPYDGPVHANLAYKKLRQMHADLRPEDIDELFNYYDSEIALTDHHVGRLLDDVRGRGLKERTAVVFTADHGEEFLDHGRIGHAHSLYGELVRVPLVIRYPGVAPGSVDDVVGLVDIFPTLLDYLGIAGDLPLEGRSLLRQGLSHGIEDRVVFTETSRSRVLRAAVSRTHKRILPLDWGEPEVYDLLSDPGEQRDLAGAGSASADGAPLQQELNRWVQRMQAARGSRRQLQLTPEMEQRLRSLGYVDN